jgi:hypothetical protein
MNDKARLCVALAALVVAAILAAGGVFLIYNDATGSGGAINFRISGTQLVISTATAGGFLCAGAVAIVIFVIRKALQPPQPKYQYTSRRSFFGTKVKEVIGEYFEGEIDIDIERPRVPVAPPSRQRRFFARR